jgi:hypothetical protein
LGNHNLGSQGYAGKEPVWKKEDEALEREGKLNPWNKFTDEKAKKFIRSRYRIDLKSGLLVTTDKVKKLEEEYLVRSFTSLSYPHFLQIPIVIFLIYGSSFPSAERRKTCCSMLVILGVIVEGPVG